MAQDDEPLESERPGRQEGTAAAGDGDRSDEKNGNRRFDAYFVSGLVVGLILVAVGFFFEGTGPAPARMVFVSGLGIVLGAFGATATVTLKPYVIGGCGAIALIFGWFLSNEVRQSYVILQVDGIPADATVQIFGGQNFYGAELLSAGIHEFVAMERHVDSRVIGAVVAIDDGADIPFECISEEARKSVISNIGGETKVFWSFDRVALALFDKSGKRIAKVGENCTRPGEPESTAWQFNLIGPAAAAETPPLDQLLKDIESKNVLTRRTARDFLADHGPEAVKPLLNAFAAQDASYRTRLGVLVGLTQMLRDNKDKRKSIS